MRIASGVVDQFLYFVAVDSTDLTTRETGLTTFTVYRSRNGGAAAAYTTPTINETDSANMPGVYELLLDEDMTIDSGDETQEVCLHITQASMAPVTRTFELYRPKITAGNTLGVEADGDLTKVNTLDGHTPQTGDSFARLGAPAGASVSADIAVIESQTDDIGVAGAGLTALATQASVDTIDANVDSILVDTGTTLPATLATIDGNVDSILADTGTDGVVVNAAGLAADAVTEIVNGVLAGIIESTITLQQAQRLQLAAAAGKLSGAATTTIAIRDMTDAKDRITATVDSDGNRTGVIYDVS